MKRCKLHILKFTIITLVFILLCSVIPCKAAAEDDNTVAKQDEFRLSEVELRMWNDPAFKKHFTRSYIAETPIEPKLTAAEKETMQEVLNLISSDKMDQAAKLLRENRTEAASAVMDFTLGNIHFQKAQLDQAQAAYEVAVEKFPKFRRAWKNLGLVYVRKGEFSRSLDALTKVIELGGNDAITSGLLGVAYFEAENYLSAESAYNMAILLDPDRMEWKEGLAKTLFEQGRYSDTITFCQKLTEQYPERADLWLLQADSYAELDEPNRAAETYELVDSLGKSTRGSMASLGDIYLEQELYEPAADSYIRAMQKNSEGIIDTAIGWARALAVNAATEQSRSVVEEIESVYSDRLGQSHREKLDKLKARIAAAGGSADEKDISVLREIVKSEPLDGQALILLGNYNRRIGNTEKAVFYYERAAGIENYKSKATVRHAELLVSQGKYTEALPLLRRAQQIDPQENIREYIEQLERVARNR
jgi:tetratricopeptide (TPR) repeat protein